MIRQLFIVRLKEWVFAVGVARKHFRNWLSLILLSILRRRGVFSSRGGGHIFFDARNLLKYFVRFEKSWMEVGGAPPVKFYDEVFEIEYFGFRYVNPTKWIERNILIECPSNFFRKYPIDCGGKVVLDIGAYTGGSVLYWLFKGARQVVAVEPVPRHFEYLLENTRSLPIIPLNIAVGTNVPDIPELEGKRSYGIKEIKWSHYDKTIETPVQSLTDLIVKYRPQIVKLNCEGCEHFCIEELIKTPQLGVEKLIVQIHDLHNISKDETLAILNKYLGKGKVINGGRHITVIWEFNNSKSRNYI
jgi:FkbM family methyltransferase